MEALERLLDEALVGVYLHGSLAMGGFTQTGSDIDLLVMTRGAVDRATLSDIGRLFVGLSHRAPAGGLEVSVVDTDSVHPFVHPAPFLLHYSKAFRDEYAAGTVDLEHRRTDPDLAAHFTMARTRGVRLFGSPAEDVLPEVPPAAFVDSIAGDALASVDQILAGPAEGPCLVPNYGVLNLCRVLAFLTDGQIRSKVEGAGWAFRHVDGAFHDVVRQALAQYRQPADELLVDAGSLVAFARWAGRQIKAAARH